MKSGLSSTILRRLGQTMITIIVASTVIFILIHLSGDPTQGFLAPGSSPELRQTVRQRLGLDQPIATQYARFLANSLTGNIGDSWRDGLPAMRAVLQRLPATFALGSLALAIAVTTGVGFGLLSARAPRLGPALHLLPSIGQAIPAFWLGAILMLVFAVRLGWFPPSGAGSASAIILPALTLSLQPAAMIARLFSTTMEDLRRADFVRTARSKGLFPSAIVRQHIAPNAALPLIGYVGLQAGYLVGGTVIVESLFAWPGVGRLALQAATQRDLPVIHAFVIVTAIAVVLVNLICDLIAARIDPRLAENPEGRLRG